MKKTALGLGTAAAAVLLLFLYLKDETPPEIPAVQVHKSVKNTFQSEISKNFRLKPVSFDTLKGFKHDNLLEALPALKKSCSVLSVKYAEWKKICAGLEKEKFSSAEELRAFIVENMQPFEINNGQQGLFTGYYEPEIEGALRKTKKYTVPLYGLPKNIIRIDLGKFDPKYKGDIIFGRKEGKEIVPYMTRKEIETKGLKSIATPVAWVKEPAEKFILQIQGSGIIKLSSGKRVSVGYAGNNGHVFVGIGSIMAKKGLLKNGVYTMSEIKEWLIQNPEEAEKLMHENPRYIFFRKQDEVGAVGSLGVPLTGGRSLAVDPAYVPLGSFLWLETEMPNGLPLNRLVTAQDTGSAIKGVIRGDFFWGTGKEALKEAGRMKSRGTYFLLLPKEDEKTDGLLK